MKRLIGSAAVVTLVIFASLPAVQAQKYECTPVNMDDFWNAVIWYQDGQEIDTSLGVATHNAGIWVSSLPDYVKPGEVNLTDDGELEFLLPAMTVGDLNAYYAEGDTIPVPPGKYQYVFLAVTSDNGNWPGSIDDWAADVNPDTGEVYDPRYEVNSFKPIYEDGEGDWIPIGIVQDWFWKTPEWVAPASGDPNDIVQQYLTYDGDPNGPFYLWDAYNQGNHDFGQYTFADGLDAFFTYYMDIPEGLTSATLWTEMWGNVKLSISTDDTDYTEVYNSATMDEVYTCRAGNPDGYQPNRELRDFDLTPFLSSGDARMIFLKFEDAAPENALDQVNNPWGARCRQLGIFKGETVKSSAGARLWPGLGTISWGAPEGGLYLIRKQYRLDNTRTLTAITLPDNLPQNDPYLIVFAITLANEPTGITQFMLY